jgi:hypothetical protein
MCTALNESRASPMFVFLVREHRKYDNHIDIGMKPGNGLKSPTIAVTDVEKNVNQSIGKTSTNNDPMKIFF